MLGTEPVNDPKRNRSTKWIFTGYLFCVVLWGTIFVNAVVHNNNFVAAISLLITAFLAGAVGSRLDRILNEE